MKSPILLLTVFVAVGCITLVDAAFEDIFGEEAATFKFRPMPEDSVFLNTFPENVIHPIIRSKPDQKYHFTQIEHLSFVITHRLRKP